MIKNYGLLFFIFLFVAVTLFADHAYGQESGVEEYNRIHDMLISAEESFLDGKYKDSIKIYDELLEMDPKNSKILEMKGLALSNLRLESTLASQAQSNAALRDPSNLNKLAMLEFYKALEINPNSVLALNGMGVGFGNFGEYSEAQRYFQKSLKIEPNNEVTKNYLSSINEIKKKYALDAFENPTKKPDFLQQLEENTIPYWIKNTAGWWAKNMVSDDEFISGIEYLIENQIVNITAQNSKEGSLDAIPSWVKNTAGWWANNEISDDEFISGIKYLIENNIIKVTTQIDSEMLQKDLERKAWNFERYLIKIQNDIKKQNRYVENINPGEYVIIKYWKDYHKWNLEQFLNKPDAFPDRVESLNEETNQYLIDYKIYINEQPAGLPIDHVSTLVNSFAYWEKFEFSTTDGKTAIARFHTTDQKADANVWVTWVVRNLGEGVLGHANLGKGVVEVAIGGYGCDGSFQLFDVTTVEYIMTHELGHSLGLNHSTKPNSIMYPSIPHVGYAYCLLN
tara:strand:+ start:923 stop:2452 length:1530 start_codon:yes stop_codon:yes gene_type:complete